MKLLDLVDKWAFAVTVVAGAAAAVAGAMAWNGIAVVSGTIAAVVPIVSRIVADRQKRRLLTQLGSRSLAPKQREQIIASLVGLPQIEVWVAFNMREHEPTQYRNQIAEAIEAAGHKAKFFGGITNTTLGIEISGRPSQAKAALMMAFDRSGIPFTSVELTDDPEGFWDPAIYVGVKPPPVDV